MDKRRKIHYIDKTFQFRFLTIFLVFSIITTAMNLWFMFYFLKGKVEDTMYQSHISIENVKEVVLNHLIDFNVLFLLAVTIFALLFYSLIRFRIQVYFKKVYVALFKRLGTEISDEFSSDLPNQFQDMNSILKMFFTKIDIKLKNENNLFHAAKNYIDDQTDENLQKLMEASDNTK